MPLTLSGSNGVAGVDGSAGTPALQGSDSNTGIAFGADTIIGSTGGSERFRCDSSGRLLVGATSSRNDFFNNTTTVAGAIQLELSASDNLNRFMSFTSNNSDTGGPAFLFGKSRGTSANSKTIVQADDTLAQLSFQGADGSDMVEAARITAVVDGTPGANDMPGRLVFFTTADGASSPTERMRITSGGVVKFTNTGSFVSATGPSNEITFGTAGQDALTFQNTASDPYSININHTTSTSNSSNYFILCRDAGNQRFGLRTNGGLHNYSANNVNLSDINTKKDITPSAGTWDCIKEWEIVNFRYKDQPDDADLNLGVIAQQVAESCPEVITVFQQATEDEPEKLGIKEQQMYWMAIKALQEAQQRIESLETRLAALEVTP